MTRLEVDLVKTHHPYAGRSFTLTVQAQFGPGVTAIFGASGSGKSTLLECIAGLQVPDRGSIKLDGRDLLRAGASERPARRGLGYIFQDAALFPHLSVRANVEYGLHTLTAQDRRVRAQLSLEAFHIGHLADKQIASISGGERQRVALARALVRDPRCLLLDEPFSALDHETKLRIMDDVMEWTRAHQVPVLLVTHALEEVLAMAQRVVVLSDGSVVASGDPRTVLADQRARLLNSLTSQAPSLDLLS